MSNKPLFSYVILVILVIWGPVNGGGAVAPSLTGPIIAKVTKENKCFLITLTKITKVTKENKGFSVHVSNTHFFLFCYFGNGGSFRHRQSCMYVCTFVVHSYLPLKAIPIICDISEV